MIANPIQIRLAQGPAAQVPAALAPQADPDAIFTGYTGLPGILETAALLAVTGAATWLSLRTATSRTDDPYVKAAGWVAGIGSGLLGLFYLGAKSGLAEKIGLPTVRVSPY